MGEIIKWTSSMDAALESAKLEKKPILLDFFNPN